MTNKKELTEEQEEDLFERRIEWAQKHEKALLREFKETDEFQDAWRDFVISRSYEEVQ